MDLRRVFSDEAHEVITVNSVAVCSHCDLRYLCNAGCRATAYNVYREFDAHNEIYCNYLDKLRGRQDVGNEPCFTVA